MPDLNPKEVAAWFREQSKNHFQLAKDFEQMAIMAEKANPVFWISSPSTVQSIRPPPTGSLTAEQFEARIKKKTSRVYVIAKEFNVPERTVHSLLEPVTKVYVGDRGWLKIRE